MKRASSNILVNARLTELFKNHPHFVATTGEYSSEFAIKHYAGTVVYDCKNMVSKNIDKVSK